jgi:hypothetical protein
MKKILALLITLFSFYSFSQAPNLDWANHYNGNAYVHSMVEDIDNNLIIVGGFEGTIDFDPSIGVANLTSQFDPLNQNKKCSIFIQKLNQQGELIWVKKIDVKSVELQPLVTNTQVSVTSDNSGGIYFSSVFSDTVDFDPNNGVYNVSAVTDSSNNALFVCKLSSNGEFLWVKSANIFGSTYFNKKELFCDSQNNISLISGTINGYIDLSFGQSANFINVSGSKLLIKLTSIGDYIYYKLLPKIIQNNLWRNIEPIHINFNDNIFTCGSVNDIVNISMTNTNEIIAPFNNMDGFFVKYDSNYNLVWHKLLKSNSSSSSSIIDNIISTTDGSVFITGYFVGSIDFDPSPLIYNVNSQIGAFFVAKFTSNGDFVWVKQFEIMNNQLEIMNNKIKVLQNNHIILSLSFDNDTNSPIPFDVDPNTNNINYTINSDEVSSVLFILDNNGNYVWHQKYSSIGSIDEDGVMFWDLYTNAQNEIYFSGLFSGTVNFSPTNSTSPVELNTNNYDGFLVKYNLGNTNSINELNDDEFTLYPNPTNGKITLKVNDQFNPELVTIKNSNGQILEKLTVSKNTSNEFEIELNAENGIYFIEVFDGVNTITKKVIKD